MKCLLKKMDKGFVMVGDHLFATFVAELTLEFMSTVFTFLFFLYG